MATPAWRASTAPASHRGLGIFSRRAVFWSRTDVGKSQLCLQREGTAPGSLARAKICSGPIVSKKVAKSWCWCWCGLGRKVAHQSVQLVRSSTTSSSRQWCGSPVLAGCNKYAPQKTAGLPATGLQKVATRRNNNK